MCPQVRSPPQLRSRGARALVVTALVALLLGGGSGFVAAADDGAAEELAALAASFGTTEPLIGDRGIYTKEQRYVGNESGRTNEPETEFARFEWIDHQPVWDTKGAARGVVGLRFLEAPAFEDWILTDPREVNLTWLVDLENQTGVAARSEQRTDRIETIGRILQPPAEETHERNEVWIDLPPSHLPDEEPLFCGLLHNLQGQVRDIRDGVELFAKTCRLDSWGGPPANVTYRPEGIARIGETTTLVLHAPSAPEHHAKKPMEQFYMSMGPFNHDWAPTTAELRVWLAPENPYPLRIEAYNPATQFVEIYRLVAFERGDRPLTVPSDLPGPLPQAERRPMQPWGPDDTGVGHPYPLSRAFQDASDDPTYGDLRALLDHAPDARVTRAEYHLVEDQTTRTHLWTYWVWGGREILMICTERDEPRPGQGPVDLTQAGTTRHETCHQGERQPHEWAQFPATMPTVASLYGIHDAIFEEHTGARSYGFDSFCPTMFGMEVEPCTYRFTIGTLEVTTARAVDPAGAPRQEEGLLHRLTITDTERLLRYENVSWTIQPKGDPQPTGDDEDRTLMPLSNAAPIWVVPDGGPLVGAALLAVVSGVFYWLWPALKSGIMTPMFSRIRRDKALDHQTRSELYEIVTQEPGVHLQALVRQSGHPEGTVRHHLEKLVEAELVQITRTDGYACCYPRGPHPAEAARRAAVLKSPGARAVHEALLARPGASGAEIAAATGLARQTVAYHMHRLRAAGLVTRTRSGGRVGFVAQASAATPDA